MKSGNKLIFAIVILGFFLRIFGIDWDSGMYLHPDERFLSMVIDKISIPSHLFDYLNPKISTLNPYNNNFMFFVYGTFPLTLGKIVGHFLNADNYGNFYYIGRLLTAFFDCLSIIILYKLVFLFEKQYKLHANLKYFSAFFYAIAVFPIQVSHFFTVDVYMSFFMLLSIYFYFKYYFLDKTQDIILAGVFFGAVLASKVSGVYIILPIFILQLSRHNKKILDKYFPLVIFTVFSYLSLRILDPKFFIDANWLNLQINPIFFDNLKQLNAFSDPNSYYPPGIQWVNKLPVVFALVNLAVFGLGIGLFTLSVYGTYLMYRDSKAPIRIIIFWVLAMFIFQSVQNVKTMRYFIFLYPFFCLFAAWGFLELKQKFQIWLLPIIVIWPIFFLNIYLQDNSRVQASKWIYENVPNKAILLTEYWDDPLPLLAYTNGKTFNTKQLPVFEKDTPLKIANLTNEFKLGDYYILSSNRAYGSIMTAPDMYPYMAKFYSNLLNNKDPRFKKVAEFTNYPGVNLGFYKFEIKDDWAEEAFTVYDHPKVLIYKINR